MLNVNKPVIPAEVADAIEGQRKHDILREAYFDLLGTEFASGINYALTTLGIAVSGVNAE